MRQLLILVPVVLLASGCGSTVSPLRSGADARLAAANVGFGAVVGAVGAMVNGDRDSATERLTRGALRGAVGGAGLYAGKWLAHRIYVDSTYAWAYPAALVHETGASMIENAAHDRPPLDRLSYHLAFVRLDVRPDTRAVTARVMPFNVVATGLMLAQDRLDVRRSLALGTLVFTGPGVSQTPLDILPESGAWAFLNTVYLSEVEPGAEDYEISAHELMHVFQHREWLRANALYAGLGRAFQSGPESSYDELASVVYLDNPMGLAAAYFLGPAGCRDDQWLEHEIDLFLSRNGGC